MARKVKERHYDGFNLTIHMAHYIRNRYQYSAYDKNLGAIVFNDSKAKYSLCFPWTDNISFICEATLNEERQINEREFKSKLNELIKKALREIDFFQNPNITVNKTYAKISVEIPFIPKGKEGHVSGNLFSGADNGIIKPVSYIVNLSDSK